MAGGVRGARGAEQPDMTKTIQLIAESQRENSESRNLRDILGRSVAIASVGTDLPMDGEREEETSQTHPAREKRLEDFVKDGVRDKPWQNQRYPPDSGFLRKQQMPV